jgi:hypothetical protein
VSDNGSSDRNHHVCGSTYPFPPRAAERPARTVAHNPVAWREAVAVQTVVSETMAGMEMDARPLICFHRADLPWGKTSVAGVALVYPRGMVRTLTNGPRRLTGTEVAEAAAAIERGLPPA